ncbi:MAG: quinolinate synthase NadA, partial [Terriglobia bacterium]
MATTSIEPLLSNYVDLSAQALDERITQAKDELGSRLVILGHHYQRDEVVKFADYRGDSLRLSQLAAHRREAEYIVFCGVHFMAESADILSGDHQAVILPDLHAGCSMADMANLEQVEVCWEALTAVNGG